MKNLTIIILQAPNISDFAATRNKELAKAKTDWVLFLDNDEELTPALEAEIESIVNSDNLSYSAYRLPRRDIFLGRVLKYGENAHNRFVRLARRDWGKWERPVHEVWKGEDDRVGEFKNPLLHHLPTIRELLVKINRYSTLEAEYRYANGIKSSLFHITCYSPAKFVQNYLLRLGILDGTPGMIMATLMSFHSYLTWTKLYLLQRPAAKHES